MSEPETTNRRSEKEIFFEAIEKATPAERAAYLDGACGKDPALRRRVEDLLAKHFQQERFMKQPEARGSTTGEHQLSEGPGTVYGQIIHLDNVGEGSLWVAIYA